MSTSSLSAMSGVKGKRSSKIPIPADLPKQSEAVMQLACKLSLDGGTFIDSKFYAFSRRSEAGTIYAPKPVYANSWMLRAKVPDYFDNCKVVDMNSLCVHG
jgi:hypothetical protein